MGAAHMRIVGGLVALVMAVLPAAAHAQASAQPAPAKAKVLSQVQPEYPESARRAGAEGTVVARIRVDADGNVRGVTIRRSPHEALSDAAEAALRRWKFQPPERDGRPVGFTAQYEFEFRLRDALRIDGALAPPAPEETDKYIAAATGVDSFRTEYWNAPGHKAFASSDEGSWGWSGTMPSADEAREHARQRCERHRPARDRPCRIVNVDGNWVEQATRKPKPLRMLPASDISVFRRPAIEEWDAARKARALGFMDECRKSAGEFVELLEANDAARLYAAATQEMRDQFTRAQFDAQLVEMRRVVGVVTSAVFIEQMLAVAKRDEDAIANPYTELAYSATTTLNKTPSVLLLIGLVSEGGTCRMTSFTYLAVGGQLPPWLDDGEGGPRGT